MRKRTGASKRAARRAAALRELRHAEARIGLPERLIGQGIRGNLHTPEHDPGCRIPPDNSGTVIVEAEIDGEGRHSLVRARAEGEHIDQSVLAAYADLVVRVWSSVPPEYPDGSRCDVREGETIGLEVAFPVTAGRGYGVNA